MVGASETRFEVIIRSSPHVRNQFTALSASLHSSSNTPGTSSVLASLPDICVSEHYARAVKLSIIPLFEGDALLNCHLASILDVSNGLVRRGLPTHPLRMRLQNSHSLPRKPAPNFCLRISRFMPVLPAVTDADSRTSSALSAILLGSDAFFSAGALLQFEQKRQQVFALKYDEKNNLLTQGQSTSYL
jgi:hypothetical protein